jgi:hypothetical protein
MSAQIVKRIGAHFIYISLRTQIPLPFSQFVFQGAEFDWFLLGMLQKRWANIDNGACIFDHFPHISINAE